MSPKHCTFIYIITMDDNIVIAALAFKAGWIPCPSAFSSCSLFGPLRPCTVFVSFVISNKAAQ
jgi:hypothetical protein